MNLGKVFIEVFPLLLKGLGVTVELTAVSLVFATIIGLLSCIMGMSKFKPLQWISKFYIWIIRGTPIMVQVFFIYFGVPQLIGTIFSFDFRLTPMMAGFITLAFNAGAYLSEIFRGGIQAVDPGQMEAARSLGLSQGKAMQKIILPQAIRVCIPSVVNQFIISLKDTSIISVISLSEIVYQAKIYIGRTMESFATWTVVACMYLVIITVLSRISSYVERRLSCDKKG